MPISCFVSPFMVRQAHHERTYAEVRKVAAIIAQPLGGYEDPLLAPKRDILPAAARSTQPLASNKHRTRRKPFADRAFRSARAAAIMRSGPGDTPRVLINSFRSFHEAVSGNGCAVRGGTGRDGGFGAADQAG